MIIGKAALTAYADLSFFANSERSEFMYEGLINNAVLGAFVPYTSWSAVVLKEVSPEISFGGVVASNSTDALSLGLDDIDSDELTFGFVANWNPKFGNNPGSYNLLLGYSNKDVTSFSVDERYFLSEITGQGPVIEKSDNYAMTIGGTQYLWVDETAQRSDGLPVGYGPFFRAGIAPDDRNLIDGFFSIGVGVNGGFGDRHDDNWGNCDFYYHLATRTPRARNLA